MAVGYNPRTVTDGLVLSLDAGNPKNYNVGISTKWTDKVGGNNGTLVNGTYHNDGPFVGAGYVEFDGTGDYLTAGSASDWTFLNDGSTFTAECWFYSQSTSLQTLLSTAATQSAVGFTVNLSDTSTGDIAVAIYKGTSGALKATSTGTLWNTNTWNHVAVVYSSSTLTIYLNGVSVATADGSSFAFNGSNPSFTLAIGRYQLATPGGYVDGYISNVRLVNGTALYTSNFTPPTKQLTAITNTVLLTCQGNSISDASSSAHTITANGDISLTKEPFAGAGAVSFDGTGDYLSIADSADFDFGTGDFTIEAWVYPDSGATNGSIIAKRSSTAYFAPFILRYVSTTSLQVVMSTSGSSWNFIQTAASALTTDAWQHVAVTRSGTAIKAFVNGTEVISGTLSGALMTNTQIVVIGTDFAYYLDGKISNLRLIKGTALYTSAFTPPSRTLEPIENTVLLTCQGQSIKDASSNAHTITVNGDAKATIVSSAFEFDGTDDELNFTNIDVGTGDFTYEAWVYPTVATVDTPIIVWHNGTSKVHTFGIWNGSAIDAIFSANARPGASNSWIVSSAISLNTWHHIAFVRASGTLKVYVDGTEQSTSAGSGSIGGDPSSYSTDVSYVGTSAVNENFKGKISAVKIYKGKGLTASEVTQNYNATKGRYA